MFLSDTFTSIVHIGGVHRQETGLYADLYPENMSSFQVDTLGVVM